MSRAGRATRGSFFSARSPTSHGDCPGIANFDSRRQGCFEDNMTPSSTVACAQLSAPEAKKQNKVPDWLACIHCQKKTRDPELLQPNRLALLGCAGHDLQPLTELFGGSSRSWSPAWHSRDWSWPAEEDPCHGFVWTESGADLAIAIALLQSHTISESDYAT
jgi:hypothetical protein